MTPSQRLEAYRWAKENFETHVDGPCLCPVLDAWALDNDIYDSYLEQFSAFIPKLYPEFWANKPEDSDEELPWFEMKDNASRHLVLDRCIAECEKIIKKEV